MAKILKSSGFDKTSIDMPMVLFDESFKMLNGEMFCMYIKTNLIPVKWKDSKKTMQSVYSDIRLGHTDSVFSEIIHDYRTKYYPQWLDRDHLVLVQR
ncbi:hypothetical protein BK708_13455 [Bacillus thuringiensis serovar yunnanensis]|nr:hypothetical protein BK708_13455 [Bacillus thuringiensis serovar yunnanensis]